MALFKKDKVILPTPLPKREGEDIRYKPSAVDWFASSGTKSKDTSMLEEEYRTLARYGTTTPTATIMGSSSRNSINPDSELYRVGNSIVAIKQDGSTYQFIPKQKAWIPVPRSRNLGTRLGTINDFIAMMAEKIKTDNENHK